MDLTEAALMVGPVTGGFISAFKTSAAIRSDWYKTLQQPWFKPPDQSFKFVWTSLYAAMGYASARIYRLGGFEAHPLAFGLYGSQLALNFMWSPLFFNQHRMSLALVNVVIQFGISLATTYTFYNIDKTAGYLMMPLQVWLGTAMCINYSLVQNNPGHDGKVD